MKKTTIKKVAQGDFIRLKDSESAPVWVRGYYYRPDKQYEIYQYGDTNHELFVRGDRVCYTDITF